MFQRHLVERSASYRERIDQVRRGSRAAGARGAGVLHRFVGDAVTELTRLEENIRADDMKAAVKLLAGARQIHVLAQRRAFPVACCLAYALNQLELRVRLLDELGDDSGQPFRSLIGPLCLAQALVVSTGHQIAATPPAPATGRKRRPAAAR